MFKISGSFAVATSTIDTTLRVLLAFLPEIKGLSPWRLANSECEIIGATGFVSGSSGKI